MAHYGILRDTPVAESGEDIRGAHVYGLNDEKLGKIDDVIFDHSSGEIRYVVVDTGGWLKSKKFIVPAERLRACAKHEDDFEVDLNKEQVESFPPYNESDLESERKWSGYEGRYRSKWVANPVMHRAETDRNVTPTTAAGDWECFVGTGGGGEHMGCRQVRNEGQYPLDSPRPTWTRQRLRRNEPCRREWIRW